jgi:hypothetical protein
MNHTVLTERRKDQSIIWNVRMVLKRNHDRNAGRVVEQEASIGDRAVLREEISNRAVKAPTDHFFRYRNRPAEYTRRPQNNAT